MSDSSVEVHSSGSEPGAIIYPTPPFEIRGSSISVIIGSGLGHCWIAADLSQLQLCVVGFIFSIRPSNRLNLN